MEDADASSTTNFQKKEVDVKQNEEEASTTSTMQDTSEKETRHHVTLLGDSIFDNRPYVVHDGPCVIEQLQFKIKDQKLPWKATLCAVDGAIIGGVKRQLEGIPSDTTVLVMSIGGNNGLGELGRIQSMGSSFYNPITAYNEIVTFCADFRKRYADNLDLVINYANEHCNSPPIPLIVCTIYYPQFDGYFEKFVASVGLGFVNSIIIDEAKKRGLPVIDLGTIFDKPTDYANPIEPGVPGGDKITTNIIKIIQGGGLDKGHVVYKDKEYSPIKVMYATKKLDDVKEKEEEEEEVLGEQQLDKEEDEVDKEDQERRERLGDSGNRSVEDNEAFRHT